VDRLKACGTYWTLDFSHFEDCNFTAIQRASAFIQRDAEKVVRAPERRTEHSTILNQNV
jgi:hypothetical protein